jgi:hypothetical protein
MSRIYLQVIRQFFQTLETFPVLTRISPRQVIPTGSSIIEEKSITCEDPIRKYEAEGISCVTRCVQDLYCSSEAIPLKSIVDTKIGAAGRSIFVHHVQAACNILERRRSGDVISVGMGVNNLLELQPLLFDQTAVIFQVLEHGVDQHDLLGIFPADQIAAAGVGI